MLSGQNKPLPWHDKDGFYKYYTPSSAKLTLQSNKRKWSTPALFNDPFDNQFDLRFESIEDTDTNALYDEFDRILHSPEPIRMKRFGALAPRLEYLRRAYTSNPDFVHTPEDRAYLMEGLVEGLRNLQNSNKAHNEAINRVMLDVSIFCLTESNDNLLMWSHYAENHTGAVIKFLSLKNVDSPLMVAQQVIYTDKMPCLSAIGMYDLEQMKHDVMQIKTLTKSKEWEYEKEWRIVSGLRNRSAQFEIIPYAPEEVGEVYLGAKMSVADKTEIVEIVRSKYPWAKIFEASKNEREFGLTFRPLS